MTDSIDLGRTVALALLLWRADDKAGFSDAVLAGGRWTVDGGRPPSADDRAAAADASGLEWAEALEAVATMLEVRGAFALSPLIDPDERNRLEER